MTSWSQAPIEHSGVSVGSQSAGRMAAIVFEADAEQLVVPTRISILVRGTNIGTSTWTLSLYSVDSITGLPSRPAPKAMAILSTFVVSPVTLNMVQSLDFIVDRDWQAPIRGGTWAWVLESTATDNSVQWVLADSNMKSNGIFRTLGFTYQSARTGSWHHLFGVNGVTDGLLQGSVGGFRALGMRVTLVGDTTALRMRWSRYTEYMETWATGSYNRRGAVVFRNTSPLPIRLTKITALCYYPRDTNENYLELYTTDPANDFAPLARIVTASQAKKTSSLDIITCILYYIYEWSLWL